MGPQGSLGPPGAPVRNTKPLIDTLWESYVAFSEFSERCCLFGSDSILRRERSLRTSVRASNGQISDELNSKRGALQGPQGRPGAVGKQGAKGEKVRPRCFCLS